MALLFVLSGIYLGFNYTEISILAVTITLVLAFEMVNTAVEHAVDMVQEEPHPVAKLIKDISAGAVLVTVINSVIVGYILFSRKMPFNIEFAMENIRSSPWHATFISIILVFGLSIIGKLIFHKGTPLRGGMPSGHSAVAFSTATVIAFLTGNSVVMALGFFMAFLIARHRIKDAVHTIWEVIAGAVLGVLVTAMIFQFLRR
jgi:diacylglycerol kinase (ATP)